ncbi:MAG: bifunctional UDP-N-acetylglucosamine diphosphorylase/glucosamine-1-phosphate N-acetyltransferase GlmU [Alphaproteobacteria bacterium]
MNQQINSSKKSLGAIVLAAGQGTRMKSSLPKVLHQIGGKPMINHVLNLINGLNAERICVVVAPNHKEVIEAVHPVATAIQQEALGTAHAAKAAKSLYEGFDGDIFILFGDTPLIRQSTLQAMLDRRMAEDSPDIVVLGMRTKEESAYGRLVLNQNGYLDRIVEVRDANAEERKNNLCNSGVMLINGPKLFELLERVENKNSKSEYYLTDIVALLRADKGLAAVIEGEESELQGVNDRVDLAAAEAVFQDQARLAAMAAGVTMISPDTVFFSHDVEVGQDVVIEPNVILGPGTIIEKGATIRAFSHIEGANISSGAIVGPYARLRPGTEIGPSARIGNFVEVKGSVIESGAKANHLAYIGDARVGAKANIGAGTITCNYDGFDKYFTDIGRGAFIGSNSALVAPVKIGDGAIVGAGSTITKDVQDNALSLERAPQSSHPKWAIAFRSRKTREKDK